MLGLLDCDPLRRRELHQRTLDALRPDVPIKKIPGQGIGFHRFRPQTPFYSFTPLDDSVLAALRTPNPP